MRPAYCSSPSAGLAPVQSSLSCRAEILLMFTLETLVHPPFETVLPLDGFSES